MAATRKSEFSGDVYGSWTVTGRAPAQDKKRAWFVYDESTGDQKVVLQTELATLGDLKDPDQTPFVPGIHQAVTPEERVATNLFDSIFMGSFYTDGEIPLDHEDGDVVNEPVTVTYVMQGQNAFSAQIARAAMGHVADVMLAESEASVALDNDHECGTYTINPVSPELMNLAFGDDWTAGLPVATDGYDVAEKVGGIGEAAEDAVSEAALDDRVPEPDPVRTAVRALMGAVHEVNEALALVQAEHQVRMAAIVEGMAAVMDKVDLTLKASLTK